MGGHVNSGIARITGTLEKGARGKPVIERAIGRGGVTNLAELLRNKRKRCQRLKFRGAHGKQTTRTL
jgi:hypothetical protein